MKVTGIPIKHDARPVTDPNIQVSAEEFNAIVASCKDAVNDVGVSLGKSNEVGVLIGKGDGTQSAVSIPAASTTAAGVMSAEDKQKLKGLGEADIEIKAQLAKLSSEVEAAIDPITPEEVELIFNKN